MDMNKIEVHVIKCQVNKPKANLPH